MVTAGPLVVCEASRTSGGVSTCVTGESHGGRRRGTTEIDGCPVLGELRTH